MSLRVYAVLFVACLSTVEVVSWPFWRSGDSTPSSTTITTTDVATSLTTSGPRPIRPSTDSMPAEILSELDSFIAENFKRRNDLSDTKDTDGGFVSPRIVQRTTTPPPPRESTESLSVNQSAGIGPSNEFFKDGLGDVEDEENSPKTANSTSTATTSATIAVSSVLDSDAGITDKAMSTELANDVLSNNTILDFTSQDLRNFEPILKTSERPAEFELSTEGSSTHNERADVSVHETETEANETLSVKRRGDSSTLIPNSAGITAASPGTTSPEAVSESISPSSTTVRSPDARRDGASGAMDTKPTLVVVLASLVMVILCILSG